MFNEILINKDNLINNIKQVKQNNPNALICAMVKANAYGVGAEIVVPILTNHVDYFGVACFFEAEKIKNLTNKKILIVGKFEKNEISERYCYTCSSLEEVNYLINFNKNLDIHLKVNSGMNRFGFSNLKEFKLAIKKILKSKLHIDGIFTHFATSDEYVEVQNNRFKEFVNIANEFNIKPIIHADNSIVQETKNHGYNMVRVGFCLYNQLNFKYNPVIEIRSKVVQINKVKKSDLVGYDYRYVANKKIKVAVLPIGYADGLDLHLIGFEINVNNVNCKILNICMDCCMLDVTKTKIKKEDYIYLINKNNPLIKFAKYLKLSEYQVMCNFSYARANRLILSSHCKDE